MKIFERLVVGLALLGLATVSVADDRDPDQAALKYRSSLMTVVVGNFGPIAAMVKGHTDFNADQMALRAERIRILSGMIEEAFTRDTRNADLDTEALDAIWENYEDFVSRAKKLSDASAALVKAAHNGEDEAKDAAKTLGGACKGCHDDYRVDD